MARTNMAPGLATFETFASGNVSGEAENAWLTFEVDPAALAEGANTLAAEVHQDRPDSSDLSFDLSLSAVRADPAAVITIGESQTIRARALDGANWSGVLDTTFLVGAAPADASNLVISEFSYRPAPPSLDEEAAGFGNRTDFEFIELMNISGDAIDLGGVRFADGIGFAFAEGAQLAAGGRVVLASNAAAFAMRYGFAPGGAFTGQLDNDGEQIVLLDAAGGAIRDFVYNDVAPWPEAADGGGFALELAAPQANPDHADPQNWRSSPAVGGSPGSAGAQALAGDPLADADGNGIADALDHAFAGDPRPIAATGIFDHEGGQAEFAVFALRLDAAADAAVRFQLSADLGTWEENAIYLGEFRMEGGVLERRYRAPMPRADSPQLFGRASVGD
ncbi:MAG: lamin tail domain-containing protein [Verrucomicrobiales bacterium]